jgi:hypothetical protein
MAATRKISHKPADKVMTIAELEAALADARAHGATGSHVPKVHVTFGGAIKEFMFEVGTAAPTDDVQEA